MIPLRPPTIFAADIRESAISKNGNGEPHKERQMRLQMPYAVIEDRQAFHDLCETLRINMIVELRDTGAPINVWRLGQVGAIVATRYNPATDQTVPWNDEHWFYLRTRASTEQPPYTHDRR